MPCSRCGKSVEWSNNVHWKSLGRLKVGEWDLVCRYKGFPPNAFSTVVSTHTWVALCDYCFDFRGGWREYVGRVASERAAEYEHSHCATRAEGVAAWNKAFGAPGLLPCGSSGLSTPGLLPCGSSEPAFGRGVVNPMNATDLGPYFRAEVRSQHSDLGPPATREDRDHPSSSPMEPAVCSRCNGLGHVAANCGMQRPRPRSRPRSGKGGGGNGGGKGGGNGGNDGGGNGGGGKGGRSWQ
jgi:hypothetical protein